VPYQDKHPSVTEHSTKQLNYLKAATPIGWALPRRSPLALGLVLFASDYWFYTSGRTVRREAVKNCAEYGKFCLSSLFDSGSQLLSFSYGTSTLALDY